MAGSPMSCTMCLLCRWAYLDLEINAPDCNMVKKNKIFVSPKSVWISKPISIPWSEHSLGFCHFKVGVLWDTFSLWNTGILFVCTCFVPFYVILGVNVKFRWWLLVSSFAYFIGPGSVATLGRIWSTHWYSYYRDASPESTGINIVVIIDFSLHLITTINHLYLQCS